MAIPPALLPRYLGRQIVDGNNFLLCRYQEHGAGLVIRNIVADIAQCDLPPLFVFDGINGNERRRKLYPNYKLRSATELKSREDLWPQMQLFRSIMPHLPCVTVNTPGWEADDVIATLARPPCRIITTDRDLSQLCALHEDIDVTAAIPGVEPEHVRLYKTFVGDSSDRIPGVPGFGPKAWDALDKDRAYTFDFSHSCGMKPRQHEWCQENLVLLQTYWKIIGLFDVPMSEITPNIVVGNYDAHKVNAILKEFLL